MAGCTGANTGINTIQVSGAEEAFPADYQARARRYLAGQSATGAGVQVSYPRTVVGETAFSPRRWYVCLTGMVPPAPAPQRIKPVLEGLVDSARGASGVYHVVLILRPGGTATAVTGFDSPLCTDGRYARLAGG